MNTKAKSQRWWFNLGSSSGQCPHAQLRPAAWPRPCPTRSQRAPQQQSLQMHQTKTPSKRLDASPALLLAAKRPRRPSNTRCLQPHRKPMWSALWRNRIHPTRVPATPPVRQGSLRRRARSLRRSPPRITWSSETPWMPGKSGNSTLSESMVLQTKKLAWLCPLSRNIWMRTSCLQLMEIVSSNWPGKGGRRWKRLIVLWSSTQNAWTRTKWMGCGLCLPRDTNCLLLWAASICKEREFVKEWVIGGWRCRTQRRGTGWLFSSVWGWRWWWQRWGWAGGCGQWGVNWWIVGVPLWSFCPQNFLICPSFNPPEHKILAVALQQFTSFPLFLSHIWHAVLVSLTAVVAQRAQNYLQNPARMSRNAGCSLEGSGSIYLNEPLKNWFNYNNYFLLDPNLTDLCSIFFLCLTL